MSSSKTPPEDLDQEHERQEDGSGTFGQGDRDPPQEERSFEALRDTRSAPISPLGAVDGFEDELVIAAGAYVEEDAEGSGRGAAALLPPTDAFDDDAPTDPGGRLGGERAVGSAGVPGKPRRSRSTALRADAGAASSTAHSASFAAGARAAAHAPASLSRPGKSRPGRRTATTGRSSLDESP